MMQVSSPCTLFSIAKYLTSKNKWCSPSLCNKFEILAECLQKEAEDLHMAFHSFYKLVPSNIVTLFLHPCSTQRISWPYSISQFSRLVVSDSLRPHGLQHARLPCPSPTPRACSNSCPLSWWCHLTISSSVVPFSFYLQPFPASWSFPVSLFFASGGQSIEASASMSVLPMNIQDWFHLGLAGLISLKSKGLSRVSFNTTVQENQFFSAQLSLYSNSHIHTWLLEKP